MKIFFVLLATVLMMSCSSDDKTNLTQDTDNNVKLGTWRVTNFSENGNNQTSNYAGYNFTFGNANVLTASNGTTNKVGTWLTRTDSGSTKMDITFPDTSGPFEDISEDWRVENSSATVLNLKHVSGGDGSIDLLTFTKN